MSSFPQSEHRLTVFVPSGSCHPPDGSLIPQPCFTSVSVERTTQRWKNQQWDFILGIVALVGAKVKEPDPRSCVSCWYHSYLSMIRCHFCRTEKPESEFSWYDKAHTKRDTRCRGCRAALKRKRYRPKNSFKPPVLPYGLTEDMDMPLSKVEAAYIAGIVDGEGSIFSSYPRSAASPLRISVTMIHKPTIEWLHAKCGGQFFAHRTKQPNARPAWGWCLKAVRSRALLRKIIPYMVAKIDEAKVALRLAETIWYPQRRGRVTEETQTERCRMGQELRDLKRRRWDHP